MSASGRSPPRTRRWSSASSSWPRSPPSSASRWTAASPPRRSVDPHGHLGHADRPEQAGAGQPRRAVRAAVGGDHAADRGRASPPPASASVCYRAAEGAAFAQTQSRRRGAARQRRRPGRRAQHRLVRLHLAAGPAGPRRPVGAGHRPAHREHLAGGAGLRAAACCARWSASPTSGAHGSALVYLYKQGTFYPFAPQGPQRRDNLLEIQIRDLVKGDLPVEPQLSRWIAALGCPRPLTRL